MLVIDHVLTCCHHELALIFEPFPCFDNFFWHHFLFYKVDIFWYQELTAIILNPHNSFYYDA